MIAKTGKSVEHGTNVAFGNLHVAMTKLGPAILALGWPEVGGTQTGKMSTALGGEGSLLDLMRLEESGC